MKTSTVTLGLLASAAASCYSAPALAQGADPFLGQMMLTPYNFCPRGWATASGQILAISTNTALFSLLGTTYGGNGQTTFALPDLRGRFPNSAGQGPGLSVYTLGEVGGVENTTLTILQMPIHNHIATATTTVQIKALSGVAADKPGAALNAFAKAATNVYSSQDPGPSNNFMDANTAVGTTSVTVGTSGGSQPFSIMPPYLTMQWCIALEGIFPSRN
jgi:microcystin-dependent protein